MTGNALPGSVQKRVPLPKGTLSGEGMGGELSPTEGCEKKKIMCFFWS